MTEVMTNLYVCSAEYMEDMDKKVAVIHAAKTNYIGSDKVINIEGDNLYLNWVDAKEERYFDYNGNGVNVLMQVLDFIEERVDNKSVVIYCDKGFSRSPSIALVYMAKRAKLIPNNNFYSAKDKFENIYPDYEPNKGIQDFLLNKWNKIK